MLKYPDEEDGFTLPLKYAPFDAVSNSTLRTDATITPRNNTESGLRTTDPSLSSRARNVTLVTWDSDLDPDNPQNWSTSKKAWVSALLFAYTFAAYIGASIYALSIPGLIKEYNLNQTTASLGMALYVFAYGIAPMVLSPLSEIPAIGRNPPYAITFSFFALLTIPISLIDNFRAVLALRFLLGICSSPVLATGGASYGDFNAPERMQYVLILWGGGATLAPVSSY